MTKTHAVGMTVDRRYRLKREVARGAAGVVYEASHLYTKRRVAIKVLTLAHVSVEESCIRLLREAEALTACRHPNVVQVLDAGEIPQLGPYVVTELLEGRTLQGILAVRQRIGLAETIQIGRQLCDALALAHARGIIHRDLKPSNTFIARDETGREVVKVFDFGIARMQHEPRRLTQLGAVLGTPEYMAPEQLLAKEEIDGRVDVYALGVMLFECLTGSVPFEGNFGEVLLKGATQPFTPIRAKAPTVPAEVAIAVEKALSREPEDRYSSMNAFAEALAQLAIAEPNGSLLGLRSPRPAFRSPFTKAPPVPPALPVGQRRRTPRAPYVTPVTIERDTGEKLVGRSEDISVGGLLVVLTELCAAEQVVTACFALPGSGQMVRLRASTQWVRTARGLEAIGLQFTAIAPEIHAGIQEYVGSMGAS